MMNVSLKRRICFSLLVCGGDGCFLARRQAVMMNQVGPIPTHTALPATTYSHTAGSLQQGQGHRKSVHVDGLRFFFVFQSFTKHFDAEAG